MLGRKDLEPTHPIPLPQIVQIWLPTVYATTHILWAFDEPILY